ncbi:beta-carotene 15,15'-monooxygenase [uncultured Chryseobacterium sp.]|jgi:hypothetical protein|uniref:beta-carotene 15,15'-monooxygenase n=1 Tax=uncultured Chryseobacterium sp. TaxID=259322 RepID=UPI0026286FD6|nr:beta-carotene 15,15'-monooxygenase [uncultured Chryseobacterium sp.]
MPDFDLDSFKKTWQEQPVQHKYDNTEILQMLNRKSRNYVKYIFWISVAEFLFFSILGLFYILQNDENNSFLKTLEKLGVKRTSDLENKFNNIYLVLKILSICITAYFVYRFYKNYSLIKIEENLKKFILNIMQFKKTVNAFILTNIILLISFTSILTAFIFYVLNTQNIQLTNSVLTGFLIGIILSTGLSVLLVWVYYRLVYGIIMRKLDKNLKQLKDIESQEN